MSHPNLSTDGYAGINSFGQHLNLPAIAELGECIPIGNGQYYSRKLGEILHPKRESINVLDQMKASMGSMVSIHRVV